MGSEMCIRDSCWELILLKQARKKQARCIARLPLRYNFNCDNFSGPVQNGTGKLAKLYLLHVSSKLQFLQTRPSIIVTEVIIEDVMIFIYIVFTKVLE